MNYTPAQVPSDPAQLPGFLLQELANLRAQLADAHDYIMLKTLYAAPDKPREGMLIKVDGTTYNPGAGAGIYARIGGSWVKL